MPPGWTPLSQTVNEQAWSKFQSQFAFRPGTTPERWPAITEPIPSVTYDLRVDDTAVEGSWVAAHDAINAEALRCFVTEFGDSPAFVVLVWQTTGYSFDASAHAQAAELAEWRSPVHPYGEYCIFSPDTEFTEGTFGHPWERTLCVFGERMLGTLGRTLDAWLPRKRVDGEVTV